MKKIKYYIFGLSIWVLFANTSCDPELCDTPIDKTIGINDSFSITPLKDSYNAGEKIIVKFTIASKARLYDDKDVVFDLFKETNKNEALLIHYNGYGLDILFANPNNPYKYITGRYSDIDLTGRIFLYQSNSNSYVLELEITLLDKGKYDIDSFELVLNLDKREVNNCHFYEHISTMKFDPPISFEVK